MRTDATFQSILQYHRVLRGKYLPHVRKRGKLRGFNVQGVASTLLDHTLDRAFFRSFRLSPPPSQQPPQSVPRPAGSGYAPAR